MKKILIYSTLGAVMILSGTYAVSNVYAHEGNVSDEVREQHFVEKEAERAEIVLAAMDEGQLTERQAEILDAMADIRATRRGNRGQERTETMLDLLNAQGLDVTEDELLELRELREDLGLMGNGYGRNGEHGMGDCLNQ